MAMRRSSFWFRIFLCTIGVLILLHWINRPVNAHAYAYGHASAYGAESVWDGGYWSNEQWQWIGYYGARTSWGHHCALPEHFDPDNRYYTWAVLTPESKGVAHRSFNRLGTTVYMRLPTPEGEMREVAVPVTDAGPFGVWWERDLQDGLVHELGWGAVAPSRYEGTTGPYFGRRDIEWRHSYVLQYCPRWGPRFSREPAAG